MSGLLREWWRASIELGRFLLVAAPAAAALTALMYLLVEVLPWRVSLAVSSILFLFAVSGMMAVMRRSVGSATRGES